MLVQSVQGNRDCKCSGGCELPSRPCQHWLTLCFLSSVGTQVTCCGGIKHAPNCVGYRRILAERIFRGFLYFWAARFFFSRRIFSPHFCGKSAQKNPPGKSPAKSSKMYTTKISDTCLQRGQAKNCGYRFVSLLPPPHFSGSEKGVFWQKGSFQKNPFSRDSREFRDSRVRTSRPFSRDSRESRDSASEKTPFVMTPFFRSRISRRGICRFPVPEMPCFYGNSFFSTESPVWIHCLPPPRNWGQKVTRNGGPQLGACVISDIVAGDSFCLQLSFVCLQSVEQFIRNNFPTLSSKKLHLQADKFQL